jgi:hypothetical protein
LPCTSPRLRSVRDVWVRQKGNKSCFRHSDNARREISRDTVNSM